MLISYYLWPILLHVHHIYEYDKDEEIPVGVMFNMVKESSSGFLRKKSAATGSGCAPCRLPDWLWVLIMLFDLDSFNSMLPITALAAVSRTAPLPF